MPLTIRSAESRDLEALGRLGTMLMRTHYAFDPQRFLAPREGTEAGYGSFLGSVLDDEEGHIFVADDGTGVIGYVYAALEPLSWKELRGPAGFIHDIAVAEEARRGGVATALLDAAIGWLGERGAPRVILWTAARNEAAQALFAKRFGFRKTMLEMTLELKR
jgi:ribosomal protein S18 acetylase RimI-like enzyme